MAPTVYRCELAWLPDGRVGRDVRLEVADGRIVAVREGGPAGEAALDDGPVGRGGDHGGVVRSTVEHLRGLVLPGLANAHSHAFHRALRGRTHADGGSFWTWRERMYAVAARLDPDRLHALARATFAEMVLAGFTGVGEFHYVHHQGDGTPYDEPNRMGLALADAARQAGIRLTLLDTCYLAGGIDRPLEPGQRRFADADAAAWAERHAALRAALDTGTGASGDRRSAGREGHVVLGAAIHSVRAVPPDAIATVAEVADHHAEPLHVHVSEQPAENEACLAAHGRTPTGLLADLGALGPRTTAVHATHLSPGDLDLLAGTGTSVCVCPTTERDLGDGIGPVRDLHTAGVPLVLGTDGHARIDAFAEARSLELDQRLAHLERGVLPVRVLLDALTVRGHRSLGDGAAGRLEVGARADLVAVDLTSVRTAGTPPDAAAAAVVFGATAADVTDVVVDGRRVVRDREHLLGDVAGLLGRAVADVTGEVAP